MSASPPLTCIEEALSAVREHAQHFRADLGIILGSGLNELANNIEDPIQFAYEDLPGFHVCRTPGHAGNLCLGSWSGISVACLRGRPHPYEGVNKIAFHLPIQLLKALGCQSILITNASGSLCRTREPGRLVLVKDHINFQGFNPLAGIDSAFVSLENAYDQAWREQILKIARRFKVPLEEGVYVGTLGPSFETPAEIQTFRTWGADVVGMSTIPEVILARFYGLKVSVISAVTNMAAGISEEVLTHELTLRGAEAAFQSLSRLISGIVEHFQVK